jgi:HemY protein
MRGLLWLLGSALLASVVALWLRELQGNVIVLVPPYRLDTSLAAFGFALIALFFVGYGAVQLVRTLAGLPAQAAAYRAETRRERAQASLSRAVLDLTLGRFSRALNGAQAALEEPSTQSAARIVGARAAHELKEVAKRDSLITALAAAPQADLKEAALLQQAQDAMDERQPKRAQEALQALPPAVARRVHALRLRLQVARSLEDWEEVLRITPLLEKRHDLEPDAAHALNDRAACELLSRARHDLERLAQCYQKLDAKLRVRPAVALQAASLFASQAAYPAAREAILKALAVFKTTAAPLESEQQAELYLAFAQHCKKPDQGLLAFVEREHKAVQGQSAWSLAAGMVCKDMELWGKARQFLAEASQSRHAATTRAALLGLAALEERLGESAKANDYYKRVALL